jgi:hypothetical protein
MKILIAIILSLTFSMKARAELSSNYDFNLGYSSLDSKTSVTSTNVTGQVTFDLNYNLIVAACKCTLTGTFQEFFKSSQGDMSFTRIAFGSRYYPFGTNSMRIVLDSKTEGRIWRASPFVALELGFSNLSIARADELDRYFNLFSNDIGIRFGNEIPIGPGIILLGSLLGITSFGGSGSGADKNTSATYTGFSLLIGLRFSSFD